MAALDFPDSPAVNDIYGSGGVLWKWDGTKWALTWSPITSPSVNNRGVQLIPMSIGADYSLVSGASVNMASGSVTFTAGRTYRLTGGIRAMLSGTSMPTTSLRTYFTLDGSTLLNGVDAYSFIYGQQVGQYCHAWQSQIWTCLATTTVTLRWVGAPATAHNIRIWGDNCFCTVEDVTLGVDAGPSGPQGMPGPTGASGMGVPGGGTVGQVLAKVSSADNDTAWQPPGATANDAITNSHLSNMAAHTFKGNNSAVTADPKDLTIAELQAELGVPTPVWVNATMISPWVYAGSNRPQNGYTKSGNRIDVRVAATGGTSGSAIFTLPSTHWPGGTLDYIGRDAGSIPAIFNIDNTGNVRWYGNAAANTLCSCYMTYLLG